MDFALVYLFQRLFYRVYDFFHHWYIDGSRSFAHRFVSTLESLDETFALAITARHFTEPLYKDYSIIGRILGIVFRSGRIVIGGAVYLLIAFCFAIVYVLWLAIPAAIIFYATTGR